MPNVNYNGIYPGSLACAQCQKRMDQILDIFDNPDTTIADFEAQISLGGDALIQQSPGVSRVKLICGGQYDYTSADVDTDITVVTDWECIPVP